MKKNLFFSLLIILVSSLCSFAGNSNDSSGSVDSELLPCPDSPNCVSSSSKSVRHKITPLSVAPSAFEPWSKVVKAVAQLPRTSIIKQTENYLHAECRSALFGFVDDLELYSRATEGHIGVRSASRLGYYDFGVNRKRVEKLRSTLKEQGILH